jgi:hypothetical protein
VEKATSEVLGVDGKINLEWILWNIVGKGELD